MIRKTVITIALLALSAIPSLACSFEPYTNAELRQQNRDARAASKPVSTGSDCYFVNAGIYDHFSGGPAIRLERQRIYHVLATNQGIASDVMVVDCEKRSATRVIAEYVKNDNYSLDSCGIEFGDTYPILAPKGPFSLTEGETLSDLENIVAQTDTARVDAELTYFLKDSRGKPVPRKDRVDFMCGCRLFYPHSAGGKS